jgi:hypothetical protein
MKGGGPGAALAVAFAGLLQLMVSSSAATPMQ